MDSAGQGGAGWAARRVEYAGPGRRRVGQSGHVRQGGGGGRADRADSQERAGGLV